MYRRWATRSLLSATAAALALVGGAAVAWRSGTASLGPLAHAVGQACARIWTALPSVLQLLLITVLLAATLPIILWIAAALRQWRKATLTLRTLETNTLAAAKRHDLLQRLGLLSRVRVVQSPRAFALTAGFTRPRVYVSTGLLERLTDDELEALLLHEQDHVRHFDPLQVLIGRTLSAAFFFVPVVRVLVRRHQAAIELAADEYATVRQGGKAGLSGAMLKLLDAQQTVPSASGFGGMTNLRLSLLLNQRVPLPAVSLTAVLQSIGILSMLGAPVVLVHAASAVLTGASLLFRCPV